MTRAKEIHWVKADHLCRSCGGRVLRSVANVGMTRERGNQLIDGGLVDLVAFGEMFVANPDLPQRFSALAPIIRTDRALHYTPGPHGYTDYPRYEPATETQDGEQIA